MLGLEGGNRDGRTLLLVVQVAELAFPPSFPPSSGRGGEAKAISSSGDGIEG